MSRVAIVQQAPVFLDRAATLANAVDLAGDNLAPLREAARRRQVSVVCGVHELDADFSRATLYNTVVTIGPDGALLNRHRKVMPTSPERMVWGIRRRHRPEARRHALRARRRADLLGELHAA